MLYDGLVICNTPALWERKTRIRWWARCEPLCTLFTSILPLQSSGILVRVEHTSVDSKFKIIFMWSYYWMMESKSAHAYRWLRIPLHESNDLCPLSRGQIYVDPNDYSWILVEGSPGVFMHTRRWDITEGHLHPFLHPRKGGVCEGLCWLVQWCPNFW